ncbi:hypothetical protein IC807_03055 [Geobacillus zalihae]|uniref:Uncharacterized protein n=1 Tax=Geobacillus zalihae TaxID=213419 RepID=A0A7H1S065_9BACL|nr:MULTISPECIES: hypothetical protein [Geobacillus]QNU19904.1 hypothetical protein IC807_03055 [Geobacillus zalihae]
MFMAAPPGNAIDNRLPFLYFMVRHSMVQMLSHEWEKDNPYPPSTSFPRPLLAYRRIAFRLGAMRSIFEFATGAAIPFGIYWAIKARNKMEVAKQPSVLPPHTVGLNGKRSGTQQNNGLPSFHPKGGHSLPLIEASGEIHA